jgi:hypothetical protein
MANKQYVLLESIFNTAYIIEEAASTGGNNGSTPPKEGWFTKVKNRLGNLKNNLKDDINFRKEYMKLGMADKGLRGAGSALKDLALNDISAAASGIKKGATAAGGHIKAHKTASGLLGLGAAGAGAYALHDKLAGLLGHHDEA